MLVFFLLGNEVSRFNRMSLFIHFGGMEGVLGEGGGRPYEKSPGPPLKHFFSILLKGRSAADADHGAAGERGLA